VTEYLLHTYHKQGDDLAALLRAKNDSVEALKAWALELREMAGTVEAVAGTLEGHNVGVRADGHHVALYGRDALAQAALESLSEREYLDRDDESYDEDDCDLMDEDDDEPDEDDLIDEDDEDY
jgi:hypothetical protein